MIHGTRYFRGKGFQIPIQSRRETIYMTVYIPVNNIGGQSVIALLLCNIGSIKGGSYVLWKYMNAFL